jgi:hypothetical protein
MFIMTTCIRTTCFSLLMCLLPLTTQAATLNVPGEYISLSAAVSAAGDNDTILIQSGAYTSNIVATISQDNLTIRGNGGKAHLNATGVSISNKKAILVTTGNNITIDNVEFSGASVPDENGAGIRHEGGLLTIKNCYFHDNENGILTSGQGAQGELMVQNSEFNHNGLGRAGYTHNIYVGHIGKFTFYGSYSHHATHGHNIKSRASENHILYSRIMDETNGNASYDIDLPNGGLTYIIGNTVHQGTLTENSTMISYAAEGASNTIQEIYVSGNTFVNDRLPGTCLRLSGSPTAIVRNNVFDNFTTAVQGSPSSFGNNLQGTSNGLFNRSGFDFHLTSSSPAINAGLPPGTYRGIDLTPIFEYMHPTSTKTRYSDGSLDIGAFEFANITSTPVPDPPRNLLLLHKDQGK